MAIGLGIVFLLVTAVLFGIAAVVHFHSLHLSLPVSSSITILTSLLPLVSFLNSFIYPSLLRSARSSPNRLYRLSPVVLQTLQGLLTAVLATLLFEGVVPSEAMECLLDNRWMHMFRAHDGGSIRMIQDTLNCCGLNSVKDRAYPFQKGTVSTCAETYGRSLACRGPWRGALQGTAGVDFGVVLAVGLLQIMGLLMLREGTSWWTAWRTVGWRREQQSNRRESRPLLTDTSDADEVVERQEPSHQRGYQSLTEHDEETGPRVQPSAIHQHEHNAWSGN